MPTGVRPPRSSLGAAFNWYTPIPWGHCLLWPGRQAGRSNYGCIEFQGKKLRAHRVAFMLATGIDPGENTVDHTCHNRPCVNPEHLRLATPKQNMENRVGVGSNNTSGIRGVHFSKREKKWKAQVSHHGKFHHVGTFTSPEEAEKAVRVKRLELFTHNDEDRKVITDAR